jgi:L,D-transpeptidase YcbB
VWSSKGKFTAKADSLQQFIAKGCKYFGLFPASYKNKEIKELYTSLQKGNNNNNAVIWAKADALFTDAFFQITKHIKNGRLYADTSNKFLDTSLHQNVLVKALVQFLDDKNIAQTLAPYEPKFNEYDSLKIALRNVLQNANKKYSYIKFPYTDSAAFIKSLVIRIKEDGVGTQLGAMPDSLGLVKLIGSWQKQQGLTINGSYNKDLIEAMNGSGVDKFAFAALSMDKLKMTKIAHSGDYVMVNIPSYYLRAYQNNAMAMESKVAVGKSDTKTPEMESEISQLVLMPNWYVPPSILKIPGYIERHRSNPNFIVRGKTVIQKSGPGNALGEMKFNFKSSDAIYLHDTNERWVFGGSRRAVSHGCVRVQQYKNLGDYVARVSPIYEQNFEKVIDRYLYDTATKDSVPKYKYVVKDSLQYKGDSVITRLLRNKIHREITVNKKVPIYIKYFTCAARNGNLVLYNDVYGYDKALIEKYFSGLME